MGLSPLDFLIDFFSNFLPQHDPSFSNKPVTYPVKACPGLQDHWIKVRLIRRPDDHERPSYWPKAQYSTYAGEYYDADTTEFSVTFQTLDGQGAASYQELHIGGTCNFTFPEFYNGIDVLFTQQLSKPDVPTNGGP
jgi:hypothetical protein